MKCLCEKDSALCSVHSTSHRVFGCPSWGTSSEPEVQQASMSKSLSFKVDALPQKCHDKSKALSFQLHEHDSSSTQSTDSSQSGIWIETLIRVILFLSTGVYHFVLLSVYISTIVKLK